MLGHTYRFQAYNDAGASCNVTIKGRRWKFSSTGALSFEASEATPFAAADVADGAAGNGTTQDNSSNAYLGGEFLVTGVIAAGSPSGNVSIYLQRSTDAGSTWPDDQTGELVAVLPFTATGTKKRAFAL